MYRIVTGMRNWVANWVVNMNKKKTWVSPGEKSPPRFSWPVLTSQCTRKLIWKLGVQTTLTLALVAIPFRFPGVISNRNATISESVNCNWCHVVQMSHTLTSYINFSKTCHYLEDIQIHLLIYKSRAIGTISSFLIYAHFHG